MLSWATQPDLVADAGRPLVAPWAEVALVCLRVQPLMSTRLVHRAPDSASVDGFFAAYI